MFLSTVPEIVEPTALPFALTVVQDIDGPLISALPSPVVSTHVVGWALAESPRAAAGPLIAA